MAKTTRWFEGVNPVRDGVYQRAYGDRIYWAAFTRGKWRLAKGLDYFDNAKAERSSSPLQDAKWRGLTSPK